MIRCRMVSVCCSRLEVFLFPGQARGPGGMRIEEKARWIADLPLLVVVVELDRGGPADFQAADLGQVNGFGVEATDLGRRIDPKNDWIHDPSFCWRCFLACWWNSGFLTRLRSIPRAASRKAVAFSQSTPLNPTASILTSPVG